MSVKSCFGCCSFHSTDCKNFTSAQEGRRVKTSVITDEKREHRHLTSINTSPAICFLSTPGECPANKNKCRIVNETSHLQAESQSHTHTLKFSPCPKELTLNKYTADVCRSQGRKNKWVCSFLEQKGEERRKKLFPLLFCEKTFFSSFQKFSLKVTVSGKSTY